MYLFSGEVDGEVMYLPFLSSTSQPRQNSADPFKSGYPSDFSQFLSCVKVKCSHKCVLNHGPPMYQFAHTGSPLPKFPTGLLIAQMSELWQAVQPFSTP